MERYVQLTTGRAREIAEKYFHLLFFFFFFAMPVNEEEIDALTFVIVGCTLGNRTKMR
jgi:hypothetical protein